MALASKDTREMFTEVLNRPSLRRKSIVWIGSRAGDYKNIDFAMPSGVISTRYGKDTIKIAENYELVSAERKTKVREDSGMEQLEPFLRRSLRAYKDRELFIIAYHSTPKLEEIASEFPNFKVLNSPHSLKVKLDEKNFTRKSLSKIGVTTIPFIESNLNRGDYDAAKGNFGLPFFLQMNVAWSGFGSFIINNSEDFERVLDENEGKEVSFMPFLKNAKSLNINAVRTANYNVFSGLSFQIIGEPNCINKRFGYCGNDFNIAGKLSVSEKRQVKEMIRKIGNWLGEQGYRGLYGLDLMSDGKNVYYTEINPRFQGSTSLFTDQQIENKMIPLTLFHLTAYLRGFSLEPKNLVAYNSLETPVDASQILLHNLTGRDVDLASSPEPGRYSFSGGKLRYLGPANFLSERQSDDEIILAGDVPLDGTRVLGASDELCKIFVKGPVLKKDGRTLTKRYKNIAQAFYNGFTFK